MSTLYGIEQITSASNPLLKDVRRAIARGGLTSDGLCVAEGFHLFEEAIAEALEVPVVLFAESRAPEIAVAPRTIVLPDALFQSIASTETTQGVIALVRLPDWSLDQLFGDPSLVVILDGIQDPGNAGAIVRAAEAFGATGVIFMKGTVSPCHPKTLRASAGSFFRVPYLAGIGVSEVRAALLEHDVAVWSAEPWTGVEREAEHAELYRSTAFIIGSEARGVSKQMQRFSTGIAIPTQGVESLNAAMAASVLLYEARRQRGPV